MPHPAWLPTRHSTPTPRFQAAHPQTVPTRDTDFAGWPTTAVLQGAACWEAPGHEPSARKPPRWRMPAPLSAERPCRDIWGKRPGFNRPDATDTVAPSATGPSTFTTDAGAPSANTPSAAGRSNPSTGSDCKIPAANSLAKTPGGKPFIKIWLVGLPHSARRFIPMKPWSVTYARSWTYAI